MQPNYTFFDLPISKFKALHLNKKNTLRLQIGTSSLYVRCSKVHLRKLLSGCGTEISSVKGFTDPNKLILWISDLTVLTAEEVTTKLLTVKVDN